MKNNTLTESFGQRLIKLRKAKGLTQEQLAEKAGSTKRTIAYYEIQSKYPPAHLLIPLAKALRISVDELLGLKETDIPEENHAALWRKLKKTEGLSLKDRKALFDYIDLLLVRSKNKSN